MTLTLILSTLARAADEPTLYTRGFGAITLHPAGVYADVIAELRTPVFRTGGLPFRDTFAGAGIRLGVTPVHFDAALRLEAMPIDLLPITVELIHSSYWESPWGLVPAEAIEDQTKLVRRPLYQDDRDFAASAWLFVVSPQLQAAAGPVVAFSNPTFTWIRLRPESGPEPWVFEPYRGLIIGSDDRLLEHTSALLWQAADGEDRPLLRLGPVLRGKSSAVTNDRSLMLGGLVQVRPGRASTAPTFLLLLARYLGDSDFPGPVPYFAGVVTFERDTPLSAAP